MPGPLDTLAHNVPFIVLQQKLKYNIHEMLKRGVPIKKPILGKWFGASNRQVAHPFETPSAILGLKLFKVVYDLLRK